MRFMYVVVAMRPRKPRDPCIIFVLSFCSCPLRLFFIGLSFFLSSFSNSESFCSFSSASPSYSHGASILSLDVDQKDAEYQEDDACVAHMNRRNLVTRKTAFLSRRTRSISFFLAISERAFSILSIYFCFKSSFF